jgi:hypothetical protein
VVVMTRAPRLVAHWVRIRPTPVLDRIYRLDQQVRCHAFQDRGRGDVCGDSIWHQRNDIGYRNAVFGVGTDCVGGGNSIAYPQRSHLVAYCCDGAADFCAKDEWKFPRVQPGPEISVDEVHADCFGLDQHFTPTGRGPRLVDVPQDFGSTRFGDFDGMHGNDSNRPPSPSRCRSGQRRGRGDVSSNSTASVVFSYS